VAIQFAGAGIGIHVTAWPQNQKGARTVNNSSIVLARRTFYEEFVDRLQLFAARTVFQFPGVLCCRRRPFILMRFERMGRMVHS